MNKLQIFSNILDTLAFITGFIVIQIQSRRISVLENFNFARINPDTPILPRSK